MIFLIYRITIGTEKEKKQKNKNTPILSAWKTHQTWKDEGKFCGNLQPVGIWCILHALFGCICGQAYLIELMVSERDKKEKVGNAKE